MKDRGEDIKTTENKEQSKGARTEGMKERIKVEG